MHTVRHTAQQMDNNKITRLKEARNANAHQPHDLEIYAHSFTRSLTYCGAATPNQSTLTYCYIRFSFMSKYFFFLVYILISYFCRCKMN